MWSLLLVPSLQTNWLWALFDKIGIDIFGRENEFAQGLNFLGRLLTIIDSLVGLTVCHVIASFVSQRHYQNKKIDQ